MIAVLVLWKGGQSIRVPHSKRTEGICYNPSNFSLAMLGTHKDWKQQTWKFYNLYWYKNTRPPSKYRHQRKI